MLGQNALSKAVGSVDHPLLRALRYLLVLALLVGCYFFAAQIGLVLRVYYGDITPLWPPSGIALALLWRYGLQWWPVIVVGEFCVALSLAQPPHMGLVGGIAQSLEALTATLLLTRLRVEQTLSKPTQVSLFVVVGALLPPLVSASIGATALSAYGQISAASYLSVWMTWWLGDAMGILIVTPFIVQWSRWPFANAREFYSWLALMAVLLATGGTIAALEAAHYSSLFFLLLPVMVVAAGHFGAAGATSTAMIMAALVLGMKHDVPAADWETSVKLAFVGSTAFAGYLIAAALASRRRSWYELAREQQRAWVTLRSIGDGVITADADGKADFINPAAERITGWPAVEARGMLVDQIFAPSPRGEWLHDKSGKLVPIESSVAEIRSPTGDISGRVISFRDVSEERRLQDELVYQANHDTLTGLHNRRTFERELLRLAESTHQPLPCALLYLDLDQFKVLNDTCGHGAGDRLLAELGPRLRDLVAAPSIFARMGGDEFGVLLQNYTEEQALAIAETLRRAIVDYRFSLHGLSFGVGASIGIAPFIGGMDNSGAVLSRADFACYRAKDEGRDRILVYRSGDADMAQRHGELERASQLHAALREGRFKLHWQRIHSLADAPVQRAFYEVLLRLEENGQLLLPAQFMPAAERFGFVTALDRWVIEQVLRELRRERAVTISVNLAGATLDDPTFYEFVMHALRRSSADASQICFEITEKVTLNRLTRAVEVIERLRAHGFRFALDDFGSGVASFGYLEDLPVDYVKIDGRFVQGLPQHSANSIIVEALTRLAALKGIYCIAEWVDSEAVMRHLAQRGVAFAQGFYLHTPEPVDFG